MKQFDFYEFITIERLEVSLFPLYTKSGNN